MADFLTLMF